MITRLSGIQGARNGGGCGGVGWSPVNVPHEIYERTRSSLGSEACTGLAVAGRCPSLGAHLGACYHPTPTPQDGSRRSPALTPSAACRTVLRAADRWHGSSQYTARERSRTISSVPFAPPAWRGSLDQWLKANRKPRDKQFSLVCPL